MDENIRTPDTYLSLVIPCFNEEASIAPLYDELVKVIDIYGERRGAEVVFVDDGSSDGTLDVLRTIAKQDKRVRYVSFSRNFGKEAAMLAGLQTARGAHVAVIDADLQHPPAVIPQMMDILTNGNCDCVVAKRTRTGDPAFRAFMAKHFYRLMSKVSDVEMVDGVGDFRLMTRKYVEAVLQLDERNRFSKGIFPWVGFRTKYIEYENVKRMTGKTKWSLWGLFRYSINGAIGFSTGLLSLVSIVGITSFLMALGLLVLLVIRKLVGNVPVDGWTTIVCTTILFGGMILLAIGVLGQYVEKMYTEIKRRPHFIVKESG